MLTIGWMPGYLVLNATGPRKYRGQVNDHFSPNSRLFADKDRLDIIWSDVGFFLALAAVMYSIANFGLWTVTKYYLIPYMIVNYHLVLITYLQHTDVYIPHFRGKVQEGRPYASIVFVHASVPTIYLPTPNPLTRTQPHKPIPGVELVPRRALHGGPLLRLAARPRLPPHLRHARLPPHLFQDALLPRAGPWVCVHIDVCGVWCVVCGGLDVQPLVRPTNPNRPTETTPPPPTTLLQK